ncbi:MFS transporter [Petrotoga sp. 9PWA.NaAc.5.4]|uniref:MFS transporter n=1 Tax=Petrotoga sp. 9PWA.NaAc.5.4 TaxID=1434328 RepID=UPI000CBCFF77|nr:MFS transporter [Petrotoga sp. 9PWA.NaAc.5.4]PNR92407.1 MFS transporter [Petrotoga sp. 9PWA.NaAc.5.4]
MKKRHPMINTLLNLKGNTKACVYTEPLWGIPFNLYTPYASVYMFALGLGDSQIGLVASIGLAFQILFALLSGAITDKLGRRKTTFIFDIIAWSVPCLIWFFAKNFTYFVVAAIINSVQRVTANSWTCLLVEDAEQEKLVYIYSWVHMAGLIAAFFAPIAGFFVAKFDVIPAVRILYLIAFVMMTSKFVILYIFSEETQQGKRRLEETKNEHIFSLLKQYGGVLKIILESPQTLLSFGILLVMSIVNMVNTTFWPLYITEKIGVSVQMVSLFYFLRSATILVIYFIIIPKINLSFFKYPLLIGFSLFIVSQTLLISAPAHSYIILVVSTLLEAFSLSLINPLTDSLTIINVDPNERARIMAILHVIMIALTSPFGWIAGILSEKWRPLPFILNIFLFVIGIIFTYFLSLITKNKDKIKEEIVFVEKPLK